jgi:uncharacterized repeat protein (TIGR03803 family)
MKATSFSKSVLLFLAAAIALPAQTLTTLVSFDGPNGAQPYYGSLIQGADGNLYGETNEGGANQAGTIFSMTSAGVLTTLHNFCIQAGCPDGVDPYGGVIQAPDGNFYGTTDGGGANTGGTVFSLSVGL